MNITKYNKKLFDLLKKGEEKALAETGPEVLGQGASKAKFIDELPIEDADELSPIINQVDNLPKTKTELDLLRNKALLTSLGAGAGATLALNLSKNPEEALNLNSAQASQEVPQIQPMPAPTEQVAPQIEPQTSEKEKTLLKFKQALSRPTASEPISEQKDIDFGEETSVARLERLREALQKSREAQLVNNLGRAGAAMVAQMSGTKNQFDEILADQVRQAESIPEDYLKEVAFEKEDPNSPMSKGYRDLAKSMGFNIKGNASAADLERLMPQLANIYNQQQSQKARAEQAALDREARAEQRAMQLELMSQSKQAAKELKLEEKKNKFIENAQKVTAKEFEKLQKIENAFDAIEQAQDEKMGPADVSILYNFIKSQDPESVVREGEIALGQRGMSLAGRLRTATLGQFTGELLDPTFRKNVLKIARGLKDKGYTNYDQSVATIRDTAKQRYGFTDDELTLIDPDLNRRKKLESQAKYVRMRLPSGTIKQIPVENKEKAIQMGAVEVK